MARVSGARCEPGYQTIGELHSLPVPFEGADVRIKFLHYCGPVLGFAIENSIVRGDLDILASKVGKPSTVRLRSIGPPPD